MSDLGYKRNAAGAFQSGNDDLCFVEKKGFQKFFHYFAAHIFGKLINFLTS